MYCGNGLVHHLVDSTFGTIGMTFYKTNRITPNDMPHSEKLYNAFVGWTGKIEDSSCMLAA